MTIAHLESMDSVPEEDIQLGEKVIESDFNSE